MTSKSLTTKEPLSFREALGILVDINVSHDEWGNLPFISMVKPPAGQKEFPDPVMVCKMVSERSVEVLANNFNWNDRRDRLAVREGKPRKNSWDTIQRKGLLRDKIQYRLNKVSTEEIFRKALLVIRKTDWKPIKGSRGPVRVFDRQKLAAAVLTGFYLGLTWVALEKRFRDTRTDLRTACGRKKGAPLVPTVPIFYKVFIQIPDHVLEAAWRLLGKSCTSAWEQITGVPAPLEFVVDGCNHPTPFQESFLYRGTVAWRRMTLPFHLITRNRPHVVEWLHIPRNDRSSMRDVRSILEKLPAGSTVLGDNAYDAGYLQETAAKSNITLIAKPYHHFGCKPQNKYRIKAHIEFDPVLYRRRKLGERIFGILKKRGILVNKRMTARTIWKGLRWALVAHNLGALVKLEVKTTIFRTVSPFCSL